MGGVNRRTILMGAGAVGVSTTVAACGGGEEPANQHTHPATDAEPAKAAAQDGAPLAKVADVPVGGGVVLAEAEVVLTQPTKGEIKGFTASCTHYGCTLADVKDGTINCSCHGSKFDLADGAVRNGPAVGALPAVAIRVEGNEIFRA
ncbi:Rieske (2Fe-2S) protein [Dactylosporangium sp. NPDC048998]|uniref:Rieske (2Fe-2S) protein n=1 Tax=Dactylosporangium sp. NPDC048998 TaxID=3363976 RepID=UPI0037200E44